VSTLTKSRLVSSGLTCVPWLTGLGLVSSVWHAAAEMLTGDIAYSPGPSTSVCVPQSVVGELVL